MPADVAEIDKVEDVEDVPALDDDDIEDVTESTNKTSTERKRLSSENTYIHNSSESAITARDSMKYEDGSEVKGFRVFGFASFSKDQISKANDTKSKLLERKDRILQNVTDFVVARNADIASSYLIEALGWRCGLFETKVKVGAGRGKSVIQRSMLGYGKMLSMLGFGTQALDGNHENIKNTPIDHPEDSIVNAEYAKTFKEFFGPGGKYDHFREENGDWKESTKDG